MSVAISPKNKGDLRVDCFNLGKKHLTHDAIEIIAKYNPGIKKIKHVNQGIKSLIKSLLMLITYIIGLYTINLF